MAEFTFEIEEHLITLSENDKGWTKELNRVSFNGAPAKWDIRTWSPDHTKMGKGVTLTNEELIFWSKNLQNKIGHLHKVSYFYSLYANK
ncbi:YdbC family protein [Streptococcus parauberis]|uniref:YdbC family protein n=1 Tax=Streptococcus parauberis TaxID=1348 RepID=UPI000D46A9FC|nr:YdbC family protein [Streptococcus parauberis]POS67110.1 hypothetical protein AOS90_01255 [Streptococcus parauberis]